MKAEAVALVYGWLTDGTTGVNALRTAVPLSAGWTAPPAVTVKSELTDAWVAREVIDQGQITGPLLLIHSTNEPRRLPFHPASERDPKPTVDVVIRYVARAVDSKTLVRDARLTMRCVERSIAVQVTSLLTSWTSNKATFDVPSGEDLDLTVPNDSDLVVAAHVIRFPAADFWALGTQ
jgi:hypothetical protein